MMGPIRAWREIGAALDAECGTTARDRMWDLFIGVLLVPFVIGLAAFALAAFDLAVLP